MTEISGLPVKGYQKQDPQTIDFVNANKIAEELDLRILDTYKDDPNVDQRWLAIGRTQIEQGWMAVNRALFKPKWVEL